MKKVNIMWRQFSLFWVGLASLGLLIPAMAYAIGEAKGAVAGTARFVQLDADAERVLNEMVMLGAEMVALEEARELPSETRLLVLVTVEPSPFFQLETIQLQIDERMASFHQYTETELAALQQGGSHRLFWGNVPAGQHQLTVSMMGRVPKDPDFQRKSTLVMVSGEGRRVVELRVAPGKSQPFPEMSLKEWK